MIDFSNLLFHCHSANALLTEPKTKEAKAAGNLSETTKTFLNEVFISEKYGRKKDFSNKMIEKGLKCEEDSITLYSRVKRDFFKKNAARITNDYLTGEPDLFIGKSIREASKVIDIKTSWDIFSFFKNRSTGLSDIYYTQIQCYMALTGAKSGAVAFCLVNTPEPLIEAEKRKLYYQMGGDNCDEKVYKDVCEMLDVSMRFDDIPMSERLIEFEVERDDAFIQNLYDKILKARTHLQEIENLFNKTLQAA